MIADRKPGKCGAELLAGILASDRWEHDETGQADGSRRRRLGLGAPVPRLPEHQRATEAVVEAILKQRGGDAEGGRDQGLRVHPQGHHAEGTEEDR